MAVAKDVKIGYKAINARAKTVDEKPMFRGGVQAPTRSSRAPGSSRATSTTESKYARVCIKPSDGIGCVELRTRIETGQTELALVPTDGSEPLRLAPISATS